VCRDEVFLAAAVAQASVLGVAVALTLGWEAPAIPAVTCSVLAAVLAGGRGRRGGGSRDELIAWTFLIAASLAVLVLSHAPVGLKSVQSVLTSTLLGASRAEVTAFAVLAAVVALAVGFAARRLTLLIIDPVMAAAVGLSVGAWSLALSGMLGLVTGLAIRSTGLIFTFGCLVLPGLAARNLCREVQPMLLVAPALAVLGVLIGLVGAHRFDFPPGQLVVVVLGLMVAASWLLRDLRQRLLP